MIFADTQEVERAYYNEQVDLHAKVKVRLTEEQTGGELHTHIVDTTVGRSLLADILPAGLSFKHVNRVLKRGEISDLS